MTATRLLLFLLLTTSCNVFGAAAQAQTPLGDAATRVASSLVEGNVSLQHYKRSLALEGLLRWAQAAGDEPHVQSVFKQAAEAGITPGSDGSFRRGPFNCLVFWLYEVSGDENWLPGFLQQTKKYYRTVHRGCEGAIEHPRGEQRGGGNSMLIDALQDYSSRMAMLGRLTEDEAYFVEAVTQHRIYRDIVRDPTTGLWCQGRGWGEDPTALSPGAWSRGHGWLIRGMVDTLLLMPPQSSEAEELRGYLRELADALIRVQQADGMWHCLLNRPASESPAETSGTALIAGNLAIAVAENFLEGDQYSHAAKRAFAALPRYVDQDGVVLSVSPGPGPLSEEEPWLVQEFPAGDQHGPFAILFAALGEQRLSDAEKQPLEN
ncbi:glycoside hydrolase family 88 protein [Aureliella helgolandensis]|uniref:Unsaturated rhamnogalacturonyl hydrolase YesR n=1 Tax=Aureliella helgolandensis TaxID=2527968 RepID=A0A518G9K2_9BACT|nr:glycoside hydrolase family 88 protein [Aureliella helgolandensis]QDV25250.1 Unsaturated rhamnogalacturonyl hydrolase YesR [Aureliella helgolandensis]